jgi:hypothetical protein
MSAFTRTAPRPQQRERPGSKTTEPPAARRLRARARRAAAVLRALATEPRDPFTML